ncbi:MAG: hypothetical protein FJ313_06710, partial [Gemmatimonadetes bacterium]|nr:hypothetical protein [Gemmatimonadota bacterium]
MVWLLLGVATGTIVATLVAVSAGGGGQERSPVFALADTSTSTATPALESTTSTSEPIDSTTSTSLPPVEAGGSWTVLVYFLADNNLEEAVFGDLHELARIPDSDSLHLLALFDRAAGFSEADLPGVGNWESAKVLQTRSGFFTEIEDLGEANLGDPAVLGAFLANGMARYPADHYALILWDHGWIYGVGADDSHNDVLTPPELASALEAARQQTGVERIDIIGFDACLMGALEVAHWVAPYAHHMIGSEDVVPNAGWDYEAFGYLVDYPAAAGEGLAREIVA